MNYEELMTDIEVLARFESLVQMPEKKDPDWPKWMARATIDGHGINGQGDTGLAALTELLVKLRK